MSDAKLRELRALAKQCKSAKLDGGYQHVGEFHGGAFDGPYVSPWTKSGCNPDADIMIIGQDWVSADTLESYDPSSKVATEGFDGTFPTNRNLNDLLFRHFRVQRGHCYLTNLFPFIKPGGVSAGIPFKYLVECAHAYTLAEIRIVQPRLVLCLGLRTFTALRTAAGDSKRLKMAQAIACPFNYQGAHVTCVAHTGAFGMKNRTPDQVERDWHALAQKFPELVKAS